jgi:hypothetical protein
MKKNLYSILTSSIISLSLSYGQSTPLEKGFQAITLDAIKAQLVFLASDWTEGREAGEKGEYLAADYIASMLQLYGVKPGGDISYTYSPAKNATGNERSYFQNFIVLRTIPGSEQIFKVVSTEDKTIKTINFTYNVDFTIRPSDPAFEIEAPVVFAGYGYINKKLNYNDLENLDVKGKIILKIAGTPKFIRETINKSDQNSYSSEFESTLKEMGAAGIIEVNPSAKVVGYPDRKDFTKISQVEDNPFSGKPDARYSIPGNNLSDNLFKIAVSVKVANEILKGSTINLEEYIRKADARQPNLISPLTGKSIYLKTNVTTTQVKVRNVLGIIEGNDSEQVIILGAHYDHMGSWNGYIWNGADDNASGTAGVMTLAKVIMETGKKPEKTIIIALWTAEEVGLLGSRYYVQNLTYPLKNLRLNVNFDMISRYISDSEPKKVTLTYTSSCRNFKDITVNNLKKYGIDLLVDYQPSEDPPGGTDHRSFVAVDIPVMRFKPGHREEYHTPDDDIDTVDWDIMEKIIKISFADLWELANTSW